MRSRGNEGGGSSREHEHDVVRLDIDCLLEKGSTVRPILTVVSDRCSRTIFEVIVFHLSGGGPAAA